MIHTHFLVVIVKRVSLIEGGELKKLLLLKREGLAKWIA
jgi:hypothetical protein